MTDKEQQEAVRRALDPRTVEARMLTQGVAEASNQVQQQVRGMLREMLELVPGQLFRDIERFHQKFGLEPTRDPGHQLPDDVLEFRAKFMLEELQEYLDACGMHLRYGPSGIGVTTDVVPPSQERKFDAEDAFDALVDLVYVALGTAFLHRFPFNEGWARVQEANMKKVRANSANDPLSKRKHAIDVVKPPGWTPPVLVDLLDEKCPACQRTGMPSLTLATGPDDCGKCNGTGRRKRVAPTK
jgi:predicted HAD superfamily Cof-like phosphohydrolase